MNCKSDAWNQWVTTHSVHITLYYFADLLKVGLSYWYMWACFMTVSPTKKSHCTPASFMISGSNTVHKPFAQGLGMKRNFSKMFVVQIILTKIASLTLSFQNMLNTPWKPIYYIVDHIIRLSWNVVIKYKAPVVVGSR